MDGFPWEAVLNTGGVFGLAVVLLYLLVDAYKQNDKLRSALADLTKVVDVKFIELRAVQESSCSSILAAIARLEAFAKNHDDRVLRSVIDNIEQGVIPRLSKLSERKGD